MDLLKRAHDALYTEHSSLSLEYGWMIRPDEYHEEGHCNECDLLREIDEALQTGHICDCHEPPVKRGLDTLLPPTTGPALTEVDIQGAVEKLKDDGDRWYLEHLS